MPHSDETSARAAALLWWLLEITIVFAFFAPTIWYFHKTLFIYDFVLALWPLIIGLSFHPKKIWGACPKTFWIYSFGFLLTLTIVFLHGRYRMNLLHELNMVHVWPTNKNEAFSFFSWVQDGITYLRFLTWSFAAMGAMALVYLSRDHAWPIPAKFAKLWAYLAVVEAIVGLISFFGPDQIRILLTGLSGYDTPPWIPRLTGTLTSPMELAAFLAPPLLWWVIKVKEGPSLKNTIPLLIVFSAFFLTRCVSVTVGVLIALSFVFTKPQNIKKHYKKILGFVFPAMGVLALILLKTGEWTLKWHDLKTRLGPWRVYLKATTSRLDYALFGLGFARTHTDNSYVHLFRTGGIILFGFYLWLVFRVLQTTYKASSQSTYAQWFFACAVAALISGLTLDSFIYRSSASCLILAGVLLLVNHKVAR